MKLFGEKEHLHTLYATTLTLLSESFRYKHNDDWKPPIIKLDGKVISLDKLVAKGGCKKVFDIGDGTVIMLPNLDVDDPAPAMWERIVQEEVKMSEKVNCSGLRAQNYKATTITVNDYPLITLSAPNFGDMIKNGKQIRDVKRERIINNLVIDPNLPHGYRMDQIENEVIGSSDLFSTKENYTNPNYWRNMLAGIADDLVLYLVNDFCFGEDSFNLIIEDTAETTPYSLEKRAPFSERNQKIHLFFYDFTSKAYSLTHNYHYPFIDGLGSVIEPNVEAVVKKLAGRILYVLLEGASNAEFRHIMGAEPSYVWNTLEREAKTILDELMPEFIDQVTTSTKEKIEALPLEKRFANFAIDEEINSTSPTPGGKGD